jgi:hypothetical protein
MVRAEGLPRLGPLDLQRLGEIDDAARHPLHGAAVRRLEVGRHHGDGPAVLGEVERERLHVGQDVVRRARLGVGGSVVLGAHDHLLARTS